MFDGRRGSRNASRRRRVSVPHQLLTGFFATVPLLPVILTVCLFGTPSRHCCVSVSCIDLVSSPSTMSQRGCRGIARAKGNPRRYGADSPGGGPLSLSCAHVFARSPRSRTSGERVGARRSARAREKIAGCDRRSSAVRRRRMRRNSGRQEQPRFLLMPSGTWSRSPASAAAVVAVQNSDYVQRHTPVF